MLYGGTNQSTSALEIKLNFKFHVDDSESMSDLKGSVREAIEGHIGSSEEIEAEYTREGSGPKDKIITTIVTDRRVIDATGKAGYQGVDVFIDNWFFSNRDVERVTFERDVSKSWFEALLASIFGGSNSNAYSVEVVTHHDSVTFSFDEGGESVANAISRLCGENGG